MGEFTFDQMRIMEAEGIAEQEVWTTDEIGVIDPILPMEITDQVPDMDRAIVCGDPFGIARVLDYQQGFDNPYGAFGTCGLTSVANVCIMGGQELTEPQVVAYAMENNLCEQVVPGRLGGGTTIKNLIDLLDHYGYASHCEFKDTADYERLAESIEGGHGVILGVNSGIMQERDWKTYNEQGEVLATHVVCVTATVRDPESGELAGFYLCDSSSQRPDGAQVYVPLRMMDACYMQTTDGFAVITNDVIRTR